MPFRLFSVIAVLVVAVVLAGCQTQTPSPGVAVTSHQDPHPPISHAPSESQAGIWGGPILDANDEAKMAVEWTVGESGHFTGMMQVIIKENTEPSTPLPMTGTLTGNTIKGSISNGPGNEDYFEGTVLRNGETLTGTVIIRTNQGKEMVMKIRLDRKPH